MLPALDASAMLQATAVTQSADAGPNVTLPVLVATPDDTENAVETRAYPLPLSSVPEVESVGETEYRAVYTVAGVV